MMREEYMFTVCCRFPCYCCRCCYLPLFAGLNLNVWWGYQRFSSIFWARNDNLHVFSLIIKSTDKYKVKEWSASEKGEWKSWWRGRNYHSCFALSRQSFLNRQSDLAWRPKSPPTFWRQKHSLFICSLFSWSDHVFPAEVDRKGPKASQLTIFLWEKCTSSALALSLFFSLCTWFPN